MVLPRVPGTHESSMRLTAVVAPVIDPGMDDEYSFAPSFAVVVVVVILLPPPLSLILLIFLLRMCSPNAFLSSSQLMNPSPSASKAWKTQRRYFLFMWLPPLADETGSRW